MPLRTFTQPGVGFLRERVHSVPMKVSSTAIDGGNTGQTHILRAGLVLGKITATGELAHYSDIAGDGTEVAWGILMQEVDLKDGDVSATSIDTFGDVLIKGTVLEGELIGYDAAAGVDFAKDIIVLTA